MKSKVISVLILVQLLSCFFFMPKLQATSLEEQKQESQEKQQEAEQKLQYVEEELSAAVVKIQELDDTIKNAEKEIAEMEEKLTKLQVNVEETTKALEKVQKQYDENQKIMEQRLVVMYECGETTYLDVLLNSANIIEFISNYYFIQEMIRSDNELLDSIEKEKDDIETKQTQLEKEKAELKLLKVKQEQTKIIMQNNKTVQENAISKLSEEEKQLQENIQKYKEEQALIEQLIQLAANDYVYDGEYTGGVMLWPVAKSGTYITSDFGIREHPIQGVEKSHTGIDIGNAGFGAPVIAAADGVVSMASYYGGYGNCVMINHGNGISTLYGHGQEILTTVGTEVKKGDLIMEVGSTGVSTGPHLHFEVRINGTPVNPLPYLQVTN